MRLPKNLPLDSSRSRLIAGSLAIAVVALIGGAVILLSGGGSSSEKQAAGPEPQVDEAPPPNRADCGQIVAAGSFESDAERDWFGENCPAGMAAAAPPEEPTPEPEPVVVSGSAPGVVKDRLVVTRLGIDAPVHTSTVPRSGQMGDPDGPYDVVWYDFSNFPGLGGYPGKGGNAVLAGHVDYHPNIQAVFWTLRNARAGDVIDYYTNSGDHLQYTIEWKKDAGPNDDFISYVNQSGGDTMTLITCDGVFNPATRHYDSRTVIRAVRSS